jgi:glycosyltransferase involved in cell wall biosynthesis
VTRINVSLVTVGDPGTLTGGYLYHRRMAEAADGLGARLSFVSFPDKRFPFAAVAGGAVLREVGHAEAMVLDSIAACYAAPWLRRLPSHIPMVAMVHQPPGGIDHRGLRRSLCARLDRAAYRRADRILVASESLEREMTSGGVPPHRIVVVPPGRDVAPATGRGAGDLRQGRRIAVLCVANWVPRKGIVDALQAVARLPNDYVTLHLVGDERVQDRYGARVSAMIGRRDLAARVVRHGPVPREELQRLYRTADVFFLPSFVEPYGTVYGEAMAEGLPVVGYDAGNLPHLAAHGREGLMASPGDIEGLAQLLGRLAVDEGARSSLATAARARAQAFPSWDQTATLFFGAIRESVDRFRRTST